MGFGRESSSSRTTETRLSRAQADILRRREEQFQQMFFPEIAQQFAATRPGDPANVRFLDQRAQQIGQGFQSAQQSLNQTLAQRGIAGSGIGQQAQVGLAQAQGRSLADLATAGNRELFERQLKLSQLVQGMAPTPTQAAPMGTSQSSSGFKVQV
jgi:predicted NBD/HSP70 family sugar kinase